MKDIVQHDGLVVAVSPKSVTVQIRSVSACASCAAHAKCGFAESKDKTLEIPTQAVKQSDSQTFAVGDPVTVTIDHSRGLLAVWFAYLLPALLLIAVIVALSLAALPEGLVALAALATLAIYILILYLFRRRLDSRFTLTVSPLKQSDNQAIKQC